ncbi:hypothetical protein LCGC14_2112870 [marine sediment metagenome]|uniref:HTH cro/C1-type domain-containing protein n=1 Tax=marine sediment metagenome TaxID=412755 RepID=A0A0F9E6M9_9ZZZZ
MGFRAWVRGLLGGKVYETQDEMAAAWGTSQSTIAHWLRGTRHPDLERCARISQAEDDKSLADIYEMVRQDTRETSTA